MRLDLSFTGSLLTRSQRARMYGFESAPADPAMYLPYTADEVLQARAHADDAGMTIEDALRWPDDAARAATEERERRKAASPTGRAVAAHPDLLVERLVSKIAPGWERGAVNERMRALALGQRVLTSADMKYAEPGFAGRAWNTVRGAFWQMLGSAAGAYKAGGDGEHSDLFGPSAWEQIGRWTWGAAMQKVLPPLTDWAGAAALEAEASIPVNLRQQLGLERRLERADGFWDSAGAVLLHAWEEPSLAWHAMLSAIPPSGLIFAAAAAGGLGGRALLGSVASPGMGGLIGSAAIGSGAAYELSFAEGLNAGMQARGIDLRKMSLHEVRERLLTDADFAAAYHEAMVEGIKKGAVVGAFSAASFGSAGGIYALQQAGRVTALQAVGANIPVQGALEGSGAALGELAATGDVQQAATEGVLEGIAGAGMSAGELAVVALASDQAEGKAARLNRKVEEGEADSGKRKEERQERAARAEAAVDAAKHQEQELTRLQGIAGEQLSLFEGDGEATAEVAGAVLRQAGITELHVRAEGIEEALQGMDADARSQFLESLGVSDAAFKEALQTGASVVVDAGAWAVHGRGLEGWTTVQADGQTVAEAEAALEAEQEAQAADFDAAWDDLAERMAQAAPRPITVEQLANWTRLNRPLWRLAWEVHQEQNPGARADAFLESSVGEIETGLWAEDELKQTEGAEQAEQREEAPSEATGSQEDVTAAASGERGGSLPEVDTGALPFLGKLAYLTIRKHVASEQGGRMGRFIGSSVPGWVEGQASAAGAVASVAAGEAVAHIGGGEGQFARAVLGVQRALGLADSRLTIVDPNEQVRANFDADGADPSIEYVSAAFAPDAGGSEAQAWRPTGPFRVVYESLTFGFIKDRRGALRQAAALLDPEGVLFTSASTGGQVDAGIVGPSANQATQAEVEEALRAAMGPDATIIQHWAGPVGAGYFATRSPRQAVRVLKALAVEHNQAAGDRAGKGARRLPFIVQAGRQPRAVEADLPDPAKVSDWLASSRVAFVSWVAKPWEADEAQSKARAHLLRAAIEQHGGRAVEVRAKTAGREEPAYIVQGLTPEQAHDLAVAMGRESVLMSIGEVRPDYASGGDWTGATYHPIFPDSVLTGDRAKVSPAWLDVPDLGTVAVGIDYEHRLPVPSKYPVLAQGTDAGAVFQYAREVSGVSRGGFREESTSEGVRRIFRLGPDADVSTLHHELFHAWLMTMEGLGHHAPHHDLLARSLGVRSLKELTDLRTSNPEAWASVHELFAHQGEQYLLRGDAPHPRQRKLFREALRWMKGIYQGRVLPLQVYEQEYLKNHPQADYLRANELLTAEAVLFWDAIHRAGVEAEQAVLAPSPALESLIGAKRYESLRKEGEEAVGRVWERLLARKMQKFRRRARPVARRAAEAELRTDKAWQAFRDLAGAPDTAASAAPDAAARASGARDAPELKQMLLRAMNTPAAPAQGRAPIEGFDPAAAVEREDGAVVLTPDAESRGRAPLQYGLRAPLASLPRLDLDAHEATAADVLLHLGERVTTTPDATLRRIMEERGIHGFNLGLPGESRAVWLPDKSFVRLQPGPVPEVAAMALALTEPEELRQRFGLLYPPAEGRTIDEDGALRRAAADRQHRAAQWRARAADGRESGSPARGMMALPARSARSVSLPTAFRQLPELAQRIVAGSGVAHYQGRGRRFDPSEIEVGVDGGMHFTQGMTPSFVETGRPPGLYILKQPVSEGLLVNDVGDWTPGKVFIDLVRSGGVEWEELSRFGIGPEIEEYTRPEGRVAAVGVDALLMHVSSMSGAMDLLGRFEVLSLPLAEVPVEGDAAQQRMRRFKEEIRTYRSRVESFNRRWTIEFAVDENTERGALGEWLHLYEDEAHDLAEWLFAVVLDGLPANVMAELHKRFPRMAELDFEKWEAEFLELHNPNGEWALTLDQWYEQNAALRALLKAERKAFIRYKNEYEEPDNPDAYSVYVPFPSMGIERALGMSTETIVENLVEHYPESMSIPESVLEEARQQDKESAQDEEALDEAPAGGYVFELQAEKARAALLEAFGGVAEPRISYDADVELHQRARRAAWEHLGPELAQRVMALNPYEGKSMARRGAVHWRGAMFPPEELAAGYDMGVHFTEGVIDRFRIAESRAPALYLLRDKVDDLPLVEDNGGWSPMTFFRNLNRRGLVTAAEIDAVWPRKERRALVPLPEAERTIAARRWEVERLHSKDLLPPIEELDRTASLPIRDFWRLLSFVWDAGHLFAEDDAAWAWRERMGAIIGRVSETDSWAHPRHSVLQVGVHNALWTGEQADARALAKAARDNLDTIPRLVKEFHDGFASLPLETRHTIVRNHTQPNVRRIAAAVKTLKEAVNSPEQKARTRAYARAASGLKRLMKSKGWSAFRYYNDIEPAQRGPEVMSVYAPFVDLAVEKTLGDSRQAVSKALVEVGVAEEAVGRYIDEVLPEAFPWTDVEYRNDEGGTIELRQGPAQTVAEVMGPAVGPELAQKMATLVPGTGGIHARSTPFEPGAIRTGVEGLLYMTTGNTHEQYGFDKVLYVLKAPYDEQPRLKWDRSFTPAKALRQLVEQGLVDRNELPESGVMTEASHYDAQHALLAAEVETGGMLRDMKYALGSLIGSFKGVDAQGAPFASQEQLASARSLHEELEAFDYAAVLKEMFAGRENYPDLVHEWDALVERIEGLREKLRGVLREELFLGRDFRALVGETHEVLFHLSESGFPRGFQPKGGRGMLPLAAKANRKHVTRYAEHSAALRKAMVKRGWVGFLHESPVISSRLLNLMIPFPDLAIERPLGADRSSIFRSLKDHYGVRGPDVRKALETLYPRVSGWRFNEKHGLRVEPRGDPIGPTLPLLNQSHVRPQYWGRMVSRLPAPRDLSAPPPPRSGVYHYPGRGGFPAAQLRPGRDGAMHFTTGVISLLEGGVGQPEQDPEILRGPPLHGEEMTGQGGAGAPYMYLLAQDPQTMPEIADNEFGVGSVLLELIGAGHVGVKDLRAHLPELDAQRGWKKGLEDLISELGPDAAALVVAGRRIRAAIAQRLGTDEAFEEMVFSNSLYSLYWRLKRDDEKGNVEKASGWGQLRYFWEAFSALRHAEPEARRTAVRSAVEWLDYYERSSSMTEEEQEAAGFPDMEELEFYGPEAAFVNENYGGRASVEEAIEFVESFLSMKSALPSPEWIGDIFGDGFNAALMVDTARAYLDIYQRHVPWLLMLSHLHADNESAMFDLFGEIGPRSGLADERFTAAIAAAAQMGSQGDSFEHVAAHAAEVLPSYAAYKELLRDIMQAKGWHGFRYDNDIEVADRAEKGWKTPSVYVPFRDGVVAVLGNTGEDAAADLGVTPQKVLETLGEYYPKEYSEIALPTSNRADPDSGPFYGGTFRLSQKGARSFSTRLNERRGEVGMAAMRSDGKFWADARARFLTGIHAEDEEHRNPFGARGVKGVMEVMRSNLAALYAMADPEERALTGQWYEGAHRLAAEWAARYNVSLEQVAGIIAVLSPRNNWSRNITQAERLLDIHTARPAWRPELAERKEAFTKPHLPERATREALYRAVEGKDYASLRDPIDRVTWLRLYDYAMNDPRIRVIRPDGVPLSRFEAFKNAWGPYSYVMRALDILDDPRSLTEALGTGHKVRSFAANILDPTDDKTVVVDVHASRATYLVPYPAGHPLEDALFSKPYSSKSGMRGLYGLYAQVYRDTAKDLGVLPRELQSVVWEEWRTRAAWGGKQQTQRLRERTLGLWYTYRAGQRSLEDVHEAFEQVAPPTGRQVRTNDARAPAGGGGSTYEGELPALGGGGPGVPGREGGTGGDLGGVAAGGSQSSLNLAQRPILTERAAALAAAATTPEEALFAAREEAAADAAWAAVRDMAPSPRYAGPAPPAAPPLDGLVDTGQNPPPPTHAIPLGPNGVAIAYPEGHITDLGDWTANAYALPEGESVEQWPAADVDPRGSLTALVDGWEYDAAASPEAVQEAILDGLALAERAGGPRPPAALARFAATGKGDLGAWADEAIAFFAAMESNEDDILGRRPTEWGEVVGKMVMASLTLRAQENAPTGYRTPTALIVLAPERLTPMRQRALQRAAPGTFVVAPVRGDGVSGVRLQQRKLRASQVREAERRLGRRISRKMVAEDGDDIHAAAQSYGFEDGDALITALADLGQNPDEEKWVRKRAGEILNRASVRAEQRLAENQKTDAVADAELRALTPLEGRTGPSAAARAVLEEGLRSPDEYEEERRAQKGEGNLPEAAFARDKAEAAKVERERQRRAVRNARALVKMPASGIRERAKNEVYETAVGDLRRVGRARADERRHGREFAIAQARGDVEVARAHKSRELYAHFLVAELTRALDRVSTWGREFKRIGDKTRDTRGNAPRYIAAAQTLARRERSDFGPARAMAAEAQDELGFIVFLPDAAIEGVPHGHLTFGQLEEVYQSVRSLSKAAKAASDLSRVEHNRLIETLVNSILKQPRKDREELGRIRGGARDFMDGAYLMHRKVENLLRELDGFYEQGPWWRAIFAPIKHAYDVEAQMERDAIRRLPGIMERAGKASPKRRERGKSGMYLSDEELMALALNWGNEGNRQAILNGSRTLEPWQVEAAIDTLDDASLEVVQDIWDFLEEYWPLLAAVEERTTGAEPPKVHYEAFVLPSGRVMRGGYYPITFDPRTSAQVNAESEADRAMEMLRGGFGNAATRQGHAKARVGSMGSGRRVWLSYRVLTNHLQRVIHDISHREAVQQVHRVIHSRDLQAALEKRYGSRIHNYLLDWLRHVAAGRVEPLNAGEMVLRHFHVGVTVAELGFSLRTMGVQVFGSTQSIHHLGARWFGAGVRAIWSGKPWEKVEWVREKSPYMQSRGRTFDRDVGQVFQHVVNADGTFKTWRDKIAVAAFWGIAKLDMSVSYPTWMGAYLKAVDAGMSEQEAIDAGDTAVRLTQGSGLPQDLAPLQRGGWFARIWTAFYTFFGSMVNMVMDAYSKGVHRPQGESRLESAVEMTKAIFLLLIIPALAPALILDGGPDPDDDEGWLDWSVKNVAGFGLSGILFLRQLGALLVYDSPNSDSPPPAVRAWQAIFETRKLWSDDRITWATFRNALMASGYALQLPTRQVLRVLDGIVEADDNGITPEAIRKGAGLKW